MAVLFAREGGRVLCVDRDADRAEETAAQIRNEGGAAFACRANITKPDEAEAITTHALRVLGRLDVLVNNVGIGSAPGAADGPAHRCSEQAFDRIIKVNL